MPTGAMFALYPRRELQPIHVPPFEPVGCEFRFRCAASMRRAPLWSRAFRVATRREPATREGPEDGPAVPARAPIWSPRDSPARLGGSRPRFGPWYARSRERAV